MGSTKERIVQINSAYALDQYLAAQTEEEAEFWENMWWELMDHEIDEAFYYGTEKDLEKTELYEWETLEDE